MPSVTAFWRSLCFLTPLLLARPAAAQENPEFRTLDDVSNFVQTYYQQPRPELIADLIRALQSIGLAQRPEAVTPLVGFFSEVFAGTQSRMTEWRAIPLEDDATRRLLGDALTIARTGGVLNQPGHSAELNDMYWGGFFATGNTAFLQKLVDQLPYYDERDNEALFLAGATAKWSLAANARSQPFVRSTLAGSTLATEQRTRDIVIQQVKQEISEIVASQRQAGKWR
jgi:hypothetical protein